LFVQRCQLGLEGQTIDGANLFSDSALSQWEWMKNYQVWVANRKVFLYPENWLDVSLRDDKSSFFTSVSIKSTIFDVSLNLGVKLLISMKITEYLLRCVSKVGSLAISKSANNSRESQDLS